jgi:hypothetical protein
MNALTTPINIPNIQRMRVSRVSPDADVNGIFVRVEVQSTGGVTYPRPGARYDLTVLNGTSIGIRPAVSPQGADDRVELFTVSTPTGFTDVLAAYAGATIALRDSAVETALIAAGLMPPGTVT